MYYTIKNERTSVTVNSFGAELTSVVCDGEEKLWQNESGAWNGHAPVLFPYCGLCQIVKDGVKYPLNKHSYARKREFTLTEQTENYLRFTLVTGEAELKEYPYSFIFHVSYRLEDNAVYIGYEVENPTEKEAYFSFGSHESFATAAVKDYALLFEKEERFLSHVHDDDGFLTGEVKDFGSGTFFPLEADYFVNGNCIILKDVNSRSVKLCNERGVAVAESAFEGFHNLLLWSPDGADMVCIEPWYNLPDRAGEALEFSERGFHRLDAGERLAVERKITYLAPQKA